MSFKFCFCCYGCRKNASQEDYDENRSEASLAVVISQPILSGYYNRFVKECLDEHNRYRALHGVPMVTLNVNLSAYATEWARNLADNDSVLVYRNKAVYGENLFVSREYSVDARTVVKSWYNEINSYRFARPENFHGADQFTQVIWLRTREIGVGIEKRGLNTWVVVNYDPKGNVPGKFAFNVPKPLKKTL